MERTRFVIHGTVQGVGFRFWVARQAERIGIGGTVRNCADGTVEVEAEGSTEALAELEAALRRGPPHADVRGIDRRQPGSGPLPRPLEIRHE